MDGEEIRRQNLFKEIDLIQEVIKRMASNSFLLKGWSLTLITAFFVLINKKVLDSNLMFFVLLPLIVFWGLDAYFLRLERLYRKLYDWVIANRLKTDDFLFDLRAESRFKGDVCCVFCVMFSKTLWWFYGSIFIATIGLISKMKGWW